MKLRFRYTLDGEQHVFDIKPRNTGAVIPLTSVGAHYAMRTYGEKQYIAPDNWYGGSYTFLTDYNAAVRSLVSRELAVDPWNLRESDMYYDHSKAMADLTKDDGQAMTYDGSAGTLNFCAFIRTEYPGGEPTPYWYIGGLTDVSPTGSAPFFATSGANATGVYGTEPMPCIDFALITVTDNGVNYPCLLVTIIPNMFFMEHFCKIRAIDILKNNVVPFIVTGMMGMFAAWAKSVTPEGLLIDFCVIFASAFVYFFLMFAFARKDFLKISEKFILFLQIFYINNILKKYFSPFFQYSRLFLYT